VLGGLGVFVNEGDILVRDVVTVKENYGYRAEIIAGSMKTQNHILFCFRVGVDIATAPESLFFQSFKHPLTDIALAEFARDSQKVPK
jgi:transaldolase